MFAVIKTGGKQYRVAADDKITVMRLAREAAVAGGLAPTVLNAANEVAVAAFLEGRLNFAGIARVIEAVLATAPSGAASDLAVVLAADEQARESALRQLSRTAGMAV